MREILFSGKRLDNGEWVEGYLIEQDIPEYHCYIVVSFKAEQDNRHTDILECDIFEVVPETIGQYSGLTDKNGKKIFEGDVFEFPDEVFESYYTDCGAEYNSWETKNRGVVGYCEDYGRFDFVQYLHNENSVDADLHENGNLQFADFIRDLEVIGNIHDNPELLGGGTE